MISVSSVPLWLIKKIIRTVSPSQNLLEGKRYSLPQDDLCANQKLLSTNYNSYIANIFLDISLERIDIANSMNCTFKVHAKFMIGSFLLPDKEALRNESLSLVVRETMRTEPCVSMTLRLAFASCSKQLAEYCNYLKRTSVNYWGENSKNKKNDNEECQRTTLTPIAANNHRTLLHVPGFVVCQAVLHSPSTHVTNRRNGISDTMTTLNPNNYSKFKE